MIEVCVCVCTCLCLMCECLRQFSDRAYGNRHHTHIKEVRLHMTGSVSHLQNQLCQSCAVITFTSHSIGTASHLQTKIDNTH